MEYDTALVQYTQVTTLISLMFPHTATAPVQRTKEKGGGGGYCISPDDPKRVCLAEKSNTGLSKKMDEIWNRYNLKSAGRIYTFGVLKCSEKFEVLDLP